MLFNFEDRSDLKTRIMPLLSVVIKIVPIAFTVLNIASEVAKILFIAGDELIVSRFSLLQENSNDNSHRTSLDSDNALDVPVGAIIAVVTAYS